MRRLLLGLLFLLAGLCTPAGAQDPGALRAAILDLQTAFGQRYPQGRAYLARLDDLERRLSSAASADEKKAADADLAALAREALLANPLVSGWPIVYVCRSRYPSDHHNTATMFQTGEINTASFRGPSALKLLDLAGGGRVTTILEAAEGILRDPEVRSTSPPRKPAPR